MRNAYCRPDTSEPGNWCICGGQGSMHHTPNHVNCNPRCTANARADEEGQ